MTPDPSDIHPELESLIDTWSEELEIPKSQILSQLERGYNLDLTEIEDEDAEKFAESFREGDTDTTTELLEKYGVPDDAIEQFETQMQAMMDTAGASGGDETGNGDSPSPSPSPSGGGGASAGGDGLTESQRQEVTDIVQQASPSADQIAAQLENRMGGAGGGGDDGGGGMDGQTQQMLAQAISQKFLQGGGQAAEIGQMFQKKAMENAAQKMFAPDPFDIMRQKWAQKQAEKWDDDEMPDWMGMEDLDMGLSEEDDDEDEGGFWNL